MLETLLLDMHQHIFNVSEHVQQVNNFAWKWEYKQNRQNRIKLHKIANVAYHENFTNV